MTENSALRGRYLRRGPLGRGAMGDVWLADDQLLHRAVAVKQLRAGGDGPDRVGLDRIVREARLAARLSHPNAVGVYDLVVEDDQAYVVMEYIAGETLADRIRETGGLGVPAARAIIGQVAGALEAAHAVGIIHRDVKPSNILIDKRGVAKLADFGVARQAGDATITQTGMVVGTPAYLAPELARGRRPTPASDIWSLGATLFAAIEGDPPFHDQDQDPLSVLVRIVSETAPAAMHAGPLRGLLARMLDRSPANRPSAAEVVAALGKGASAAPAGTPPNGTRPPIRTRPMEQAPTVAAREPERRVEPPPPPNGAAPTLTTPFPPVAPRRRLPLRWIAAAAAALAIGVAIATLLMTSGGHPTQAKSTGKPTSPPPTSSRPSSSRPAGPPPTSAATPSAQPTAQSTVPTAPSSHPMTSASMRRFVREYYALIPNDLPTAFSRLGPGLQAQGFPAYQAWWSRFSSVSVTPLGANPGAGTVTIRLSAVSAGSGDVATDTERLTLITTADGQGLLINADEVISSR